MPGVSDCYNNPDTYKLKVVKIKNGETMMWKSKAENSHYTKYFLATEKEKEEAYKLQEEIVKAIYNSMKARNNNIVLLRNVDIQCANGVDYFIGTADLSNGYAVYIRPDLMT